MIKTLLTITITFLYTSSFAQWTQSANKLIGLDFVGESYQGGAVSMAANGKTIAVGGYNDSSGIGAVWVYSLIGNNWIQMGKKLIGSGSIGKAGQGCSVSLSSDGKTLAVGGYNDSSGVGAVWVYSLIGNNWFQMGTKLVGSGHVGRSNFGTSVCLSGDGNTLAVGGISDSVSTGATWVYSLIGNNWIQIGKKLVGNDASGIEMGQGQSVSLSFDGKTLAVGAANDNGNGVHVGTGATWIYTFISNKWEQVGKKLVGAGNSGFAIQGYSVSLSSDGKTLAVGGQYDNNETGAVWIFSLTGGVWTQMGDKLVGSGNIGKARQGYSVSLSSDGTKLAIGGAIDNSDLGAIWTFTFSGSKWIQLGNKVFDSSSLGSIQGCAVSLSSDGNTLAVGGRGYNNNVGATWVYSNSLVTENENKEFEQVESINVYPNPFQQNINIKCYDEPNYVLSDLNGNTMEIGMCSSSSIGSHQKSGVYNLKVGNKAFKVVKMP